jgi:hypothetical protein
MRAAGGHAASNGPHLRGFQVKYERFLLRNASLAALLATALQGMPGRADDAPPAQPGARAPQETWQLVPAVLPAYQPETSFLIGGAAVLALQYPEGSTRRESQILLAGAVTVRKQYSALLQPDLYLWQDRIHLGATLSAARFPDLFFGIGETRREDQEWFTPIYYELELSPKLRVLTGAYLGPSFRVLQTEIVRTEAGGALASGAIPGSRGGSSVELGLSLLWDTRDRTLYPRAGGLLRARLARARDAWGSDFDYDVLRLDARRYVSLPWPGQIVALQALVELRTGTPPFYGTGRLGGAEMLRGYYEGRYRDRQYLAAQGEYRLPLVWRLGAVLFLAAGSVAPALDELALERLKVAAGAGLRLAPLSSVPVNVRLDIAYGDDLNFYFGIGEAF